MAAVSAQLEKLAAGQAALTTGQAALTTGQAALTTGQAALTAAQASQAAKIDAGIASIRSRKGSRGMSSMSTPEGSVPSSRLKFESPPLDAAEALARGAAAPTVSHSLLTSEGGTAIPTVATAGDSEVTVSADGGGAAESSTGDGATK